MKNAVQDGNVLTLTAPYDVVSGAGVLVGSIFGVASGDTLTDAEVETVVVGVFALNKKAGDTVTQGLLLYWDDTAKEVTITASGNTLIGKATLDAAGGDTTVNVRLNV